MPPRITLRPPPPVSRSLPLPPSIVISLVTFGVVTTMSCPPRVRT